MTWHIPNGFYAGRNFVPLGMYAGCVSDTDDLRSASRALKEAITGLSRALGQGLSDVGADVGREIASELNDAARELAAELSGTSIGTARRAAQRSAKAEQTRADLLAAAARVFAERGYEAASVTDLAKAAGYTKGALYAHFASKEALFLELIDTASAASEADHEGPATAADDGFPHEHDLTEVVLSLEAYLYALRHPEVRSRFAPIAERQLANLAARVHHRRTGTTGEPTRDDRETALALACCRVMGGVMGQVLPPEWDVPGALDRMLGRIVAGGEPAA
jgi:AcrR family transcriptional regulator